MANKIFNKCKRIDFLTPIYISKRGGKYNFIGVRDKRKLHEAVLYTIPNKKNPNRPYLKGIQKKELESAWAHLRSTGVLTKTWFSQNLADCNDEGGCNFKAICGLIDTIYPGMYYIGHGNMTRL